MSIRVMSQKRDIDQSLKLTYYIAFSEGYLLTNWSVERLSLFFIHWNGMF